MAVCSYRALQTPFRGVGESKTSRRTAYSLLQEYRNAWPIAMKIPSAGLAGRRRTM